MALCSLSFGLGACSGTAGVAPTTQALPMQALHEHLSGDSQTFGHLYVGDTVAGQKSALIFPLNGGLPGAQSGTLYAQKRFLGPQGLAVGPDGQIYISGGLGRRHIDWSWVDVYPAGASGHTAPARTIQSQGTQGGITVDQNNYLYWGVQIFAPGAHGAATPLQTLPISRKGLIGDLPQVDNQGNLYIDNELETAVFSNPITNPVETRSFCWNHNKGYESYSLAVAGDGTAYVGMDDAVNQPGEVLVFKPGAHSCDHPLGIITASVTPALSAIVGLALGNGYLYVLSYDSRVVVLDPTIIGPQKPLATISGLPYPPWALALGP